MKDLFRIISHRFQKNKKQSVSVLAIIITFVMVYSLIMPAVAIERDAAEKEPGLTIEESASENVAAEAMAEAEPASLEAEASDEAAAVESAPVEEAAAEEPAAEEIEAETAPAAAPAQSAADDSYVAADTSAAQQGANVGAAQQGTGVGASANTGAAAANTGAAQADGNTDGKADPSDSDTKTSDAEEEMPAQNFEQVIKYKEIIDEDGNTVDKEIKVVIDAAKNTFPAGTTMKAELILNNADIEKAVEDAVKLAAGELADATSIVQYRAVDITFADKDGQKVEPAKKVEVRITSDKIVEIVNPMLVHVNVNDQNGRVINADVFPKKDVSIIDEKPDTIDDNENTMLFKASRFSPYVIVESQTIDEDGDAVHGLNSVEENADKGAEADDADGKSGSVADGVLIAESDNYTVTIKFDENANIPDDAEIDINEIPEASRQYQSYMSEAEKLLVGDENTSKAINYAKVVDVNIVSASEGKVTPDADVDVDIAYKETEEIAEGTVMQALSFNGRTPEVEKDALVYGGETHVDGLQVTTDKLPAYAIVGTETISAQYITAEGDTYTITVTYGKDAEIPEGATLEVSELANDNKEYTDYVEQTAKALAEGEEVPFVNAARLFDISIMADGKKVEPKAPVEVKIEYSNAENLNETSEVGAVHFKESTFKTETEVMDVNVQGEEGKVDGVTFTTDSFSIYAVVIIDKEAGTFVVEDENYKVTITYTKEANIPIGTELTVKEITPEEDRFWELRKATVEKINEGLVWEDSELTPDPRKGVTDAIFFDISLVNGGKEIEPDVPIQVKIEYKNDLGIRVPADEETEIVHFAKSKTEIIDDVNVQYSDVNEEGSQVAISYEYEQGSFSEVGSYSTGEYIEINESNIVYPSAGIMAAPVLRAAGDSSITAAKTITDVDNDGVYELALSVTGSSESSSSTTVNKSNVVLVIDTSGSMGGQNYVYTPYTYNASTYDYPNTRYYTSDGTEVRRNNNNTGWRYVNYNSSYTGTVYTRQTRLEATKAAASALVDALLANNKNEDKDGVSLRDIVEISLISFSGNSQVSGSTSINDAVIRVSSTSGNTTNATVIKNAINNLSAGGGTNWEAALRRAKTEADSYASQTGESTSVIFLTDGMPTFYLNNADSRRAGNGGTGTEERDNVHNSWTYAADDARALVSAGYTLYNIFAFGTDTVQFNNDNNNTDADYLRSLTNYAYKGTGNYNNKTLDSTTSKYFFNASNTTALQEAFNAIINSINNTVGYGGVTVDDGVTTGVTNTSVTVDGTVNDSSFHYFIKNGNTVLATVKINGNTATFTSPTTGNTATATGVETTVNINGTNHTNTLFTATLDGVEYKICPARMDNKGEVVWELAPVGIIENGRTYEVSFDVWPNQFAYDLVADLNNGIYKTREEALATISDTAVRSQVDTALVGPDGNGKYSIKTNYQQYVDYYTVDTTQEEGQDPVTTYTPQPRKELGPKDPVALTSSTMDLIKHWEDSLDEDQLGEWLYKDYPKNTQSNERTVKLHVWKADTLEDLNNQIESYSEAADGSYAQADEHDYLAKTLGWNGSIYVWEDSLEVAPGTMIELSKARDEMGIDVSKHTQVTYGSKTYVVLESGHYYTVTEENIERHFELNTIIYHPMLIDGVLSNVTFKADGTVESIVPMSSVDATNTLKGGINVLKRAFDGETEIVATDDVFTVQITVNNADGTPYRDWDYRIYYGDNNPLKTDTTFRSDHFFGTQEAMDASGSSGQVDPVNGGSNVITLDLYIGDTVRIINVPAGVTYSVVETKVNGEVLDSGSAGNYVFNRIKYEISEGNTSSFVEETGDIHTVKGNSSSQATVYNKIPTQKIGIKKIGDGSITNTLEGVSFKLYKDSNANNTYDKDEDVQIVKDALGHAIGTNGILTTDENGTVEIGTLLAGKYFLVETDLGVNTGYNKLTAAVTITVNSDSEVSYDRAVSYVQDDYSACNDSNHAYETGKGLLIQEMTDEDDLTYYYYTVTVNNSTGVTLPNTGGSGTLPYTLGGLALIMASALMYGFRMRRRERRLN